jgi:hypothetical protein
MRGWTFVLATLLAACAPRVAWGDPAPPPAERGQVFSPYELETIALVLGSLRAKRVPNPEGKLIERVDVVPLEVIEPRDPAPRFLNLFHATTRKAVIRRELLLEPGKPYSQVLVDDTLRNLRRLPELSLVLVVAVEGSAPDRVGLVVITKDVWSLRLSWNVVGTPGGLEELDLAPTETNLFGTQQTVRAEYIYEPLAHNFGGAYVIPRIDSSRVALEGSANLMINRQSGHPEGSYGGLLAGEPIVSGLTPWAWDARVAWNDIVFRRYQNAQQDLYVDPKTGIAVPYAYRYRKYEAVYNVTRSLGWATKHDFTLSASVVRQVYRTELPGYDPVAVADFAATQVPRSDTRVGPSLTYHMYTRRYLRVIDFETLGLQEDFGLGPDVLLQVFPSFRAFGATRDVIDLQAALQYTIAVRDGLARVFVITDTQPALDRVADALFNPGVHIVSPTIANLGRIIVHASLSYRYRNYLNVQDNLGGENRLRGYPTSYFFNENLFSYNFELRSRPVEVLSCQLGGVLFHDVGDGFQGGLENLRPHHSVGFGVRILFPQLDRIVFRADVGFPLERPIDATTQRPIAPVSYLITFGQAFDVPTIDPSPVLPTGATETAWTSSSP